MKKLVLLFLLWGCSAKSTEVENHSEKQKDIEAGIKNEPEVDAAFLNLFKDVTFDTLHIFFEYTANGGRTIQGVEIPEKYLSYFPEEVRLGATEWSVSPVYACYKFKYSPELIALIANVPSEYDATAFNIFLYSDKEGKIIHSQRIAEFTGDAGYSLTEDSWLLDLNKDSYIDLVTKKEEIIPEDEELEKFTYADSTFIYLGDKRGFKKVEQGRYNTEQFKVHKYKG